MATDVDVQYFSHLNGLTLGNNWGDLIRLLDKALVTGIDFTQITAASIDEQGDVHITLYAAHNAMLFQVVELSGFTPSSLNQKYRIKGVPNTTKLILKPALDIVERSISTSGAAKLASLGYEIVFRDSNDVKRVYRAKNPTTQHPYIRVDESLASPDGTTGVYASTYAKFAMVGLLEHMDHIDDFENPDVLQLPFDPVDPAKNWKITGTGTGVIRGWSRWYWARNREHSAASVTDTALPGSTLRSFTFVGNEDCFYFQRHLGGATVEAFQNKLISGCGLYNTALKNDIIPNWFLMTQLDQRSASASMNMYSMEGGTPLGLNASTSSFYCLKLNELSRIQEHVIASPIMPDYQSGWSGIYSASNYPVLEIPFSDAEKFLRGGLLHIHYSGKRLTEENTTVTLSDTSMYISDRFYTSGSSNNGSVVYYMGELE